jgi:hypothetical protein
VSNTDSETPRVGLHAVYGDAFYETTEVGRYFYFVGQIWPRCEALAYFRETGFLHPSSLDRPTRELENEVEIWRYLERQQDALVSWLDEEGKGGRLRQQDVRVLVRERHQRLSGLHHRLGEQLQISRYQLERLRPDKSSSSLQISGLRLNSPLDISLAVQGGALTIVVYGMHILVHVMKDPERVGAWLPRVVKGFRIGMQEATRAKQPPQSSLSEEEHMQVLTSSVAEIQDMAQEGLEGLHPDLVETEGAGDTPEDITGEFYD